MHTNTHTGIILRTGINTSWQSEQWVGYDKEKGKAGKEKNKKNKNKKIEDWGRRRLPAKVGIPTLGYIKRV
jgi:hypothetical protein